MITPEALHKKDLKTQKILLSNLNFQTRILTVPEDLTDLHENILTYSDMTNYRCNSCHLCHVILDMQVLVGFGMAA